ncbi:MAG: hypothetical protein JRI22_03350, partial [Deltaproteobacteria bacterium]|nr:hypothetical protein [Deltaproteobacteria bacterium]
GGQSLPLGGDGSDHRRNSLGICVKHTQQLLYRLSGLNATASQREHAYCFNRAGPCLRAGRKCYFEDATRNFIHRAHRYGPDYPGLAGRDLSRKGLIDAGCPQEWQAWVEPTVEAPTVAVTGGTFSPGQQLQITVTCAGPGPYDILAGAQVGNTKYYIQNNQFLEAGLRAPALRNHTPDGAPITVLDMTVLPGWGEFSVDIFAEVSNPGAIQSIADATGSLAISAGTDGGGVDDGGGDDGGGDDGGGGDGGGY